MIASVFGMLGSVNSKNLVPVSVENTVKRKKLLSMVSMPEGAEEGSGFVQSLCRDGSAPGCRGSRGVKDLVMAWTPWNVPARTR
jgi:hypothetical protein